MGWGVLVEFRFGVLGEVRWVPWLGLSLDEVV